MAEVGEGRNKLNAYYAANDINSRLPEEDYKARISLTWSEGILDPDSEVLNEKTGEYEYLEDDKKFEVYFNEDLDSDEKLDIIVDAVLEETDEANVAVMAEGMVIRDEINAYQHLLETKPHRTSPYFAPQKGKAD